MPQDDTTEFKVKMRELEMKIERIIDHEKEFRKSIEELVASNFKIEMSIDRGFQIMKKLPERVDELEKKVIEKTTFDKLVNAIILIVLGMLISHFVKTQILAPREEDKYNIESIGK